MTISTHSPASVPVTQKDSLSGLSLHQVSACTSAVGARPPTVAATAAVAARATVESSERMMWQGLVV